jgi:hypothetical protein
MENEPGSRPGDEIGADGALHRDPMAPPEHPCECFCLHCRRIFRSDQMWFQRVKGARDGFAGFWMCPTPNCSGAGFSFDIFPTDPDHPANEGWHDLGEEEPAEATGEYDAWEKDSDEADAEWDPEEPGYKSMDAICADEDDIEGEEWKYGLEPGQAPGVNPPPPGMEPRNWAEEEAMFNSPDLRPRELDWSDREQNRPSTGLDEDISF